MEKVWIVQGETGQYDDRIVWLFGWFETEEAAVQCTTFLKNMLKLAEEGVVDGTSPPQPMHYGRRAEVEGLMKKFDPDFRMDYTGTKYSHFTIPKGVDFSNLKLTDAKIEMFKSIVRRELEDK